jgi:GTP cyclohydrolase IB
MSLLPAMPDCENTPNQQGLSLEDVQGKQDTRGISLQRVGVSQVEMPIRLVQKNGQPQTVAATAKMSVDLPAHEKGTHMSRFIIQLAQWSEEKVLSLNIAEFLTEMKARLKAHSAQLDLTFKYFINRQAPVSAMSAPMGYLCQIRGRIEGEQISILMGVTVPCSTLCPCSKAISDFGAHNQRAEIRATLQLDTAHSHPMVWLEDIIAGLEETASCPVFPLLKRADEKWVTERQYTNAKFVEDVIRDATLMLRQTQGVSCFSLEVEALESIHAHNAWVAHAENFDANLL